MVSNVIGETGGLVQGVMIPALQTFAKMIVAVCIFILLLVFDPVLSLIMAAVVGGSYLLVFLCVRERLAVIGELASQVNRTKTNLAKRTSPANRNRARNPIPPRSKNRAAISR